MKYKLGDRVEVSKKLAAGKEIHDQLGLVDYIVTIVDMAHITDIEEFYYVTDGTGKHDWFSLYDHHILRKI
jgi:hypothetical protein